MYIYNFHDRMSVLASLPNYSSNASFQSVLFGHRDEQPRAQELYASLTKMVWMMALSQLTFLRASCTATCLAAVAVHGTLCSSRSSGASKAMMYVLLAKLRLKCTYKQHLHLYYCGVHRLFEVLVLSLRSAQHTGVMHSNHAEMRIWQYYLLNIPPVLRMAPDNDEHGSVSYGAC